MQYISCKQGGCPVKRNEVREMIDCWPQGEKTRIEREVAEAYQQYIRRQLQHDAPQQRLAIVEAMLRMVATEEP